MDWLALVIAIPAIPSLFFVVQWLIVVKAPGVGSDADDTAKTILTLNLLGQPVSPKSMLAVFEKEEHFVTYAAEKTPTFAANCKILAALLQVAIPDVYTQSIEKAVRFLCDCWWESDSSLIDRLVRISGMIKLLGYS